MSAEQDAGKSGKKLFSIIGFGALLVLTGGYWLVSWLMHDPAGTASAVNLNGTASSSNTTTAESPRYRELLKASNDLGAEEATRNNTSFIASLPVGLEATEPQPDKLPVTPTPSQPAPRTQPDTASRTAESAAREQQASEQRKAQLEKLLARISAPQAGGEAPVLAASFGKTERPTPATTAAGQSGQQAGSQTREQLFVPALTRASASMETAVDSDNTASQVVAVIPAGRLAGARLHSASVKLAGNGVEVHFTRMSWNGMELDVNAYAQREDNLMSSVATDVNHRWGTHIVLPAILGGIGDLGGLYRDANTQIMQTDVSTVTGRVGKPDAGTVAGVMIGGTAQTGAEVIAQEVAREPFRQVTVKQNEVVSILFVDAVSSANIVGNKNAAAPPASAPAMSPATAVQQTETRLQDAIARRQAEMRRQYDDTVPREEN